MLCCTLVRMHYIDIRGFYFHVANNLPFLKTSFSGYANFLKDFTYLLFSYYYLLGAKTFIGLQNIQAQTLLICH